MPTCTDPATTAASLPAYWPLVSLVVGPIITAAAGFASVVLAADRGVRSDFEKQRRALSYTRRIDWYDRALTAARELYEEHFRVIERLGEIPQDALRSGTGMDYDRVICELRRFDDFAKERRPVLALMMIYSLPAPNKEQELKEAGLASRPGLIAQEYERSVRIGTPRDFSLLLKDVRNYGDKVGDYGVKMAASVRVLLGYHGAFGSRILRGYLGSLGK